MNGFDFFATPAHFHGMFICQQYQSDHMPHYVAPIVRRDLLTLWHEFWDSPGKPTNRATIANENGSLGRTVFIEARNIKEAAKIAGNAHPRDVVVVDAISKVD